MTYRAAVLLLALLCPAAAYAQSMGSSGPPIVGGTVGSTPPTGANNPMFGVLDSSGNVGRPALIGGNGSPLAAMPADTTTASTALGSNGATITIPLAGERGAVFQLQSGGTGVYTVTPQCSYDGGTIYNTAGYILDAIAYTSIGSATIASAQATTDYPVLCPGGASHVQMKVTAYTSGTANWLARATAISPIVMNYGSDGANIRAIATTTAGITKSSLADVNGTTPTEKAASTAPALTDTSLVMAQSPNANPVCTSIFSVNQTASADLGTLTNFGYICSIVLISATAQNLSLVEGTGTTCATGIAALIGGTTASVAVAANGGFSAVADRPWLKMKTSADHLCLLQSSTGNISGIITYQDHT